jgi:hypothetical protein
VHERELRPQLVLALPARRNRGLRPARNSRCAKRAKTAQSRLDRILVAHRVNPGIPLGEGSEGMRRGF